jgi:hypothetical protein
MDQIPLGLTRRRKSYTKSSNLHAFSIKIQIYRQQEDVESGAPLLVLANKSDKAPVDVQHIAEFLELKVTRPWHVQSCNVVTEEGTMGILKGLSWLRGIPISSRTELENLSSVTIRGVHIDYCCYLTCNQMC